MTYTTTIQRTNHDFPWLICYCTATASFLHGDEQTECECCRRTWEMLSPTETIAICDDSFDFDQAFKL